MKAKNPTDMRLILRVLRETDVLDKQQHRTLEGQVLARDVDGAKKGLRRIIRRLKNNSNIEALRGVLADKVAGKENDMFEFAEKTKDMTAKEILNYYRNLYYAEPQVTERGIVANAINDVLVDVVPKSEVDKWYHEYHVIKDELKQEKMYHRETEKLADKYCAELQTAKTELAREIFTEIDGLLTPVGYKLKTIDFQKYINLKKKYTEEAKNES